MSKSVSDKLSEFKKKYGDKVGGYGVQVPQVERIQTGFFAFDLATGGGIPRGRVTIIYGPESSGKSNCVLRTIAANQRERPHEDNVYVDAENSFDPPWAEKLGVDVDKLIVLKPDYAEQAVDMVAEMMKASNIGVIAVDSLAALITTNEAESSAEKAAVGGSSAVVGKLVRKTSHELIAAEKEGRAPTLIYVNQTRFKVGFVLGDPETMPGGNAPKFQAALIVRVFGKNIMEKKLSEAVPAFKQTTFTIKKWKVPIVAIAGEYRMCTLPHDGQDIGDVDEWDTIAAYMKQFELLTKAKSGWTMCSKDYPTLTACEQALKADQPLAALVRKAIIEESLKLGVSAGGDLASEVEA